MSWMLRLSALLLLVATMPARSAVGRDDPAPLRISASVTVPMRRTGLTSIEIEPDGSTRITQAERVDDEPILDLKLRLTPAELQQGRRAVVGARFFESWKSERPALDHDRWDVTVRLGGEERARARIGMQPEFEPLRAFLFRFVTLADVVAGLRRDESDLARVTLRYRSADHLVQHAVLVTEVVACAAGREEPSRCAAAAKLLVALPAVKDWLRGANTLLPRLEGERRAAVLSAWAEELQAEDRAAHRAAFAPLALTEVAGTWKRWLSMGPPERRAFWFLLSMLLQDGSPQAFVIAEQMARTLGAPGKPVVSPGLLQTGTAAVPIVRRLLQAMEPGARASGAGSSLGCGTNRASRGPPTAVRSPTRTRRAGSGSSNSYPGSTTSRFRATSHFVALRASRPARRSGRSGCSRALRLPAGSWTRRGRRWAA